MSEATTATPTSNAPNQTQGTTTDTPIKLENITGEQAKAMVAAEKAAKQAALVQKGTETQATEGTESKSNTPASIKEAAAEAIRKYKVKVDGEELEVDEDELKRGYTHQRAANKKLQEGLAARKQAEEFISMMKNPEKFYETASKLGHDPRRLAEEYLVRQLEDEMLDPRDKELKEAKAKLKQIEDMEKQQKEKIESQRNEALKAKYAQDYTDQFVSALQESNLPPTKPMVAEMAKYIHRSAKLGFKMTAQEAAQLVKEDVMSAHQRLIGDSDGETLLKLLGDNVANKIRKYDVSKLKNPEQMLKTPTDQAAPRESKTPNRRMTPAEWRKFNHGY